MECRKCSCYIRWTKTHTCFSNHRNPNAEKVRIANERRRKYNQNWKKTFYENKNNPWNKLTIPGELWLQLYRKLREFYRQTNPFSVQLIGWIRESETSRCSVLYSFLKEYKKSHYCLNDDHRKWKFHGEKLNMSHQNDRWRLDTSEKQKRFYKSNNEKHEGLESILKCQNARKWEI